jgi:hypothetical protein
MRVSSFPAWSPDGLNLLYWVGEEDEARLMLRSTAGGEARDVTPRTLNAIQTFIRWSEDGRKVLIPGREIESGRRAFFAYTLSTGEIEYVFSSDEIAGVDVPFKEFSSDWGTVYLLTEPSGGPIAVLRRDVATGDQRTLLGRPGLSDGGEPISRMWASPDDASLAFWEIDEPAKPSMLKVISTDGGEPRTLLTVPYADDAGFHTDFTGFPQCSGIRLPLWTSDGRHLLTILRDSVPKGEPFPPNPCKLYKVPVEGGDPIFVGAIPQHERVWALSPDDSRLAFETGEFRGEIWILQGLSRR